MPRGLLRVRGIEPLRLRIAFVGRAGASAVAEVDPPDEADGLASPAREEEHELLVMGSCATNAGIQEHLSPRLVHDASELSLLLLVESQRLRVGSPQQSPDPDLSSGRGDEEFAEP